MLLAALCEYDVPPPLPAAPAAPSLLRLAAEAERCFPGEAEGGGGMGAHVGLLRSIAAYPRRVT